MALLEKSQAPYLAGGRVFQSDPHAMHALIYLSNTLGATLPEARWGDTLIVGDLENDQPTIQAILDYNFGKYQLLLWPDTASSVRRLHTKLPPLDVAQPATMDEFTICAYNAHGMGRGSEQYWEPQEYDRQLAKRARTIVETLQGCTIIGLQEMGTPEDVVRLTALISDTLGIEYAAVAFPGPGTASNEFPLTNALLARADRTLIVNGLSQQGCSAQDYDVVATVGECPLGQFPLFNRPPLVVDLTVQGLWNGDFAVTVIVNHWKSKGGDESINVVRRTAQAAHVATLVQEKLALDPTANVVVVGDLNDYYESGPIETLSSNTTPPLVHTFDRLPALDRYTYIFNGGSQVLDHILVTPNLEPFIARVDPVHVNADYPSGDNNQVVLLQRSSDHDPIVLQIRPQGAGTVSGNLSFPAVNLTLTSLDGRSVAQTTTDALGDFRFWALAPGNYQLQIDAPAHFNHFEQTGILTVTMGHQTVPAIKLVDRTIAAATALLEVAPHLISQAQIAVE